VGPGVRIQLSAFLDPPKIARIPPLLGREQKGFCPGFCPRREGQRTRIVRRFADKPARSEEVVLFAPSRNSVLPDGSLAAKEIFEAICSARRERTFTPGMASNGFAPKATSTGRTSRPSRMRSHPALAQRRDGEFEVLAYNVGVRCNRRGEGFSC
jgi:hypothetical protein